MIELIAPSPILSPGATLLDRGATFCVWAPHAQRIDVHLLEPERFVALTKDQHGYFSARVEEIQAGTRYLYRIDGHLERPDPVSHSQPEGVHGPSEVVDHAFAWGAHTFAPPALQHSVFYEVHPGTFTQEGTFDAMIPRLPLLKDLGVTTIQLMPIAQFPGQRNWGYDGVYPYAPQSSYGGVQGLKRFVRASHEAGLAVFLDVVYNHLGPEGNYLRDFGPYFTDQYRSPWGESINLDGAYCDAVRQYFIQNALYWLDVYKIDGLRLDATHALFDFSARPFLAELTETVNRWADEHQRSVYLIAENDQSDRFLTLPRSSHGLGLDGQWLDDLHHTLHTALTGESDGYYADYTTFELLPKVLQEGFAYSGQYSPARKRRHGTSSADLSPQRFVVASQTHDQVGNRMLGERLSQLTTFDGLKLAACLIITSPYVPMLFMGEEYGEMTPFLYFTSHTDEALAEAVRKGRKEEFADFDWAGSPPDPQDPATFTQCVLSYDLHTQGHHAQLFALYRFLLSLRRTYTALTNPERSATRVFSNPGQRTICLERSGETHGLRICMNFDIHQRGVITLPASTSTWVKLCDSNSPAWSNQPASEDLAPESYVPNTPMTVPLMATSFAIYHTNYKVSP